MPKPNTLCPSGKHSCPLSSYSAHLSCVQGHTATLQQWPHQPSFHAGHRHYIWRDSPAPVKQQSLGSCYSRCPLGQVMLSNPAEWGHPSVCRAATAATVSGSPWGTLGASGHTCLGVSVPMGSSLLGDFPDRHQLLCRAESHRMNWDPLRWKETWCSPPSSTHLVYGHSSELTCNRLPWNTHSMAFGPLAPHALLYRAAWLLFVSLWTQGQQRTNTATGEETKSAQWKWCQAEPLLGIGIRSCYHRQMTTSDARS